MQDASPRFSCQAPLSGVSWVERFLPAGPVPPALGGLKALESLYLFGNNLTGELTAVICQKVRTGARLICVVDPIRYS